MSIRNISNKGGNIIGSFPSLKNGRAVPYESTIERDLLYFLEFDSSVRSYSMQPFIITGLDLEGKPCRYIPDVLITYPKEQTLIECKPVALKDTVHTQQQVLLGQQWADNHNSTFVLITDEDLRTGHRLANIKLLWRYARLVVPQTITAHCIDILSNEPSGVNFSILVSTLMAINPSLTYPPYLYALLFQHVLTTDLDHPLNSSSRIYYTVQMR